MSKEIKSFGAWILFFLKVNLGLLALLFLFVPMYPWWVPGFLALVLQIGGPSLLRINVR